MTCIAQFFRQQSEFVILAALIGTLAYPNLVSSASYSEGRKAVAVRKISVLPLAHHSLSMSVFVLHALKRRLEGFKLNTRRNGERRKAPMRTSAADPDINGR